MMRNNSVIAFNMTQALRFLHAVVVLMTATIVSAQPRLVFKSDVVNMGELTYQQPRAVTFELTNKGASDLMLTSVKPSCGCTTVEWPSSAIAPGQSATIKVTFDARMLGYFQKELEVRCNGSTEPIYLTLQGRVVPISSNVEGDYPVDMGDVRLSSDTIVFAHVNHGDRPEAHLFILNNTRKNITPELMHLPSYLTASYHPETLAGGRVGQIRLTLLSERMRNYGANETDIYLSRHPGDKVTAENAIHVSALLLPSFKHMSEQELLTAPLLILSPDSVDFSARGSKKKVTQVLHLHNAGERALHINNVQLKGQALTVSLSSRTIKPGKHAKLKVTLQANYLKADNREAHIILITNDPTHSHVDIPITF